MRWYGLLAEALDVLETGEDALVAVLGTEPGELDNPAMELAHQVNTAVAVCDGRALVVTYLLDSEVPGQRDPRGPAPAVLRGPALSTALATVPGAQAVLVRGGGRDEREGEIQQPGGAPGESFGASLSQLYLRVTGPETSAALRRALELHSFLAVAEEQVDNT